jgi:hypothetical protein
MYADDDLGAHLEKARAAAALARMPTAPCPDCTHVAVGLSEAHAADLLAIHQEGTCQGPATHPAVTGRELT